MKFIILIFISFSQAYIQVDVHNQLLAYTNKHIIKAVLYKYLIGNFMNPDGNKFNLVQAQILINQIEIGKIQIGQKNFLEVTLDRLLLNIEQLVLENFTGNQILLGFIQRYVQVKANNLLIENVKVFCFMKPNSDIPQIRCQIQAIDFDQILSNMQNIKVNGVPLNREIISIFLPLFLDNSKILSTTQQINQITTDIINNLIRKIYKKKITFNVQKSEREQKIPLDISLINIKSPIIGGNKNKRIRMFIEGMQSKGVMENDENHPCFTFLFKKKFFQALTQKVVQKILNSNQIFQQTFLCQQNFVKFYNQLHQSSTSSTNISKEKSKAFLVAYIDKS